MGSAQTVLEQLDRREGRMYYPNTKLRPFPIKAKISTGLLLTSFRAVPLQCVETSLVHDHFWWTDCQFVPNDDCQLVTTAGPYDIRGNRPWRSVHGTPLLAGQVCLWKIKKSMHAKCKIFEGTSSSSFPKVQVHPDGQRLVLISNGGLRGVSLTNENWFAMKKESRLVDHVFCAFSPNGRHLAVLSRMQMLCKLSIYSCSRNSLRLTDSAMCHKLCPGFIGNSALSDHIECKWSPDSQYVAISSSFGILFVVNHDNLTNHCTVIPGLLNNCSISTARAYDFDPRYFSNIMAVCTDNRQLFLVNISSQYLLYMTDIIRSGNIECVQFSSDGEILALAVSNFRIYLYDSNHGSLVRIINPCVHCPDIAAISPSLRPTIIRLSFSQSREQIAVSSSDGVVRIWQLSPLISLQHLCKRSILSSVNASRIQQLPLPAKLKEFLKAYPT